MIVLKAPVHDPHRYSTSKLSWIVDMAAQDRFEWETYEAMRVWLHDNVRRYHIHRWSIGAKSIEAVSFAEHSDAMLFYLRFL